MCSYYTTKVAPLTSEKYLDFGKVSETRPKKLHLPQILENTEKWVVSLYFMLESSWYIRY